MPSTHRHSTAGPVVRAYRKALCLYPSAYRKRFAIEMEQVFREQWREVQRRRSSLEILGFMFWMTAELLLTAGRERIATFRKRPSMKSTSTSFGRLGWSLAGGAVVTAAILALVIGVTLAVPKTYMSSARVHLRGGEGPAKAVDGSPSPFDIDAELAAIRSSQVLRKAAERAKLAERWSPIYLGVGTLQPAEIVEILKDHLEVRPLRLTPIAEIRVYDRDRQMAADIANAVAESYVESSVGTPETPRPRASVIDLAEPGLKPVRPNVPLNVFLGLLAGGVLGIGAAGALWLILCKATQRRAGPPSPAGSPA